LGYHAGGRPGRRRRVARRVIELGSHRGGAMAAYVIADIEITDPAGYEDYRRRGPAIVAQYKGRYLARGGAGGTLEGGWQPPRLVVLEFPSLADARLWYESPEYREPRAIRQRCSRGHVILVEGA